MIDSIAVLTNDIEFEHYLTYELNFAGYKTKKYRRGLKNSVVLFDCDTVSPELKNHIESIGEMIISFSEGEITDYNKTFSISELVKQIGSIIDSDVYDNDNEDSSTILYDSESRTITCREQEISLTQKEAVLFGVLYENRGKTVPYDILIKKTYSDTERNSNKLTVHIRYLRKKLDDRFGVRAIVNVRGIGYMLK